MATKINIVIKEDTKVNSKVLAKLRKDIRNGIYKGMKLIVL